MISKAYSTRDKVDGFALLSIDHAARKESQTTCTASVFHKPLLKIQGLVPGNACHAVPTSSIVPLADTGWSHDGGVHIHLYLSDTSKA